MPLTKHKSDKALRPEQGSLPSEDEAIEQLKSADPSLRQAAARSLAGFERAAAPLCDRFIVEDNPQTREALAVAIMRTGGRIAVEKLLPLLSSESTALRNHVIEILQALPADVAPHMEELLDNPDSDVRIFAVNILEALRHPKVEDWLIAVISTDTHANVVGTALDLLVEVGTKSSIPSLMRVRERFAGEPYLQFAASNAIQRIGAGS